MAGPVRYCPACYAVNAAGATHCERCGATLLTEESFDERLVWALRHPDTETAILAAQVLGARRSRSAVPALLEATESDDPYRAAAAARALRFFTDDDRAVTRLRRLVRSPSVVVRRAAEAALAASGSDREDEALGSSTATAERARQPRRRDSGRGAKAVEGER